MFDIALERAVERSHGDSWDEMHAPQLQHPLSPVFPEAAGELDMQCAPIGGDNDTIFATYSAGEGFATKYSALARTTFDVGKWNNCRWVVFQGASGEINDAHRADQNVFWAKGATVPMRYDWEQIAGTASLCDLDPAEFKRKVSSEINEN
ncbi:penicillin acylase family protein [Paraburkholderia xenovorans]|uniref:penicillin acylase family protein n=1 Tax=Paraburkholderia xenovorans TaxID=36873 RepID=UPI0038BC38B9